VARLVRLHVRRHTSDPKGWSDEVRREADRAIPLFEQAGGHAELARAWRLLFYVHATASRIGEATRAARRVIEHARLAGDARREGLATTAYATAALYGPTPVPEAIRECEEIVTQGLDHRQSEGIVLCALAHLRAMQGEIEPARELYGRARSILDDQGDQVQAATASIDSAAVEMLAGDPVAAERELRGDYETLGRMGEKLYLPTVAALLAQAVYAQGRYDEADELARVAEELAPEDDVDAQALWRCVRAKVAARKGTTAEAAQLARAAVDLLDEEDGPVMKADALSDLAEVLLLARRTPEARTALEQAASLYERKGNAVSAARTRALLARVSEEAVPASP
jgi:tetratricopeptide (TPR) repeat protein